MLGLINISKTFNRGTPSEVKALDGVDLSVGKNEFLMVLGSNGSGKSTLLNAVAGNIFPDSGTIHIDNTDVTKWKEHQRSKLIARVFQKPDMGTVPDLSIVENFRLASLRTQTKKLRTGITQAFRKRVTESLSLLDMGLESKPDQLVGTLSGGQRQALTLAMAVMDKASVLLMDEPSSALDPRSSETVMLVAEKIISSFHLAAICVTHNLRDAARYGTRVIFMQEGTIVNDTGLIGKGSVSLGTLQEWFT